MITAFLILAAVQSFEPSAGPRRVAVVQEGDEKPTPLPVEKQPSTSTAWLDFSNASIGLHVTRIAFSTDFVADAHLGGGFLARAPSPWLSQKVVGLTGDDLGVFIDLEFGAIQRDFAALADDSGGIFFATLGIDATLFKSESWLAQLQVGGQYGDFGGVDDLNNGFALLLGLNAGLRLFTPLWLTASPQVSVGNGGDAVFFLSFGLQFDL